MEHSISSMQGRVSDILQIFEDARFRDSNNPEWLEQLSTTSLRDRHNLTISKVLTAMSKTPSVFNIARGEHYALNAIIESAREEGDGLVEVLGTLAAIWLEYGILPCKS